MTPCPDVIRIAVATLDQTPLDWAGNAARIRRALETAKAGGANVVCLPELCITGYGCEDAFLAHGTASRAEESLLGLLDATRGMVVAIGLPRIVGRGLYDAVALCVDGRVVGLAAKRHLAGDGIHYEPRWFKAWPDGAVAVDVVGGARVPFGDLLFEVGGVRIGHEICEDAWVADRPGAALAAHGCDIILNPSGSHFAFGKQETRERFVVEGSRAFGCAYAYANLMGNEAGRAIYDGGSTIASLGRVVARGPRLRHGEVHVAMADVDIRAQRMERVRSASHRPAMVPHPGLVVDTGRWSPGDGRPTTPCPDHDDPTRGIHGKEEEFTRAQALGLAGYLRKSRAAGFVVSLSGGCDSAAVVVLVHAMVRTAIADLGMGGFIAAFAHVPGIDGVHDARGATGLLLTTLYQATACSGSVTTEAARTLADAVGAKHLVLDVGALVDGYVATVGGALGRMPTWATDDIALQNIQARVRGPSAWMVANLENKLLLATSNRSEAAAGYATMDGDTCGGLSPIAGIDKAWLRIWLRWMETTGPAGMGPIPALAAVTAQRSTPELRPPGAGQRSEEDLMPFDVLDAIERLAIRDKLAPVEILRRLEGLFPAHAGADLRTWTRRFHVLWCRNQWKRERFAPAFHLDDENLDPKTWCRFPILSSGFAAELADLDRAEIRP